MTEFETRLHECLEALREGRWDLDECLRRYPEHAACAASDAARGDRDVDRAYESSRGQAFARRRASGSSSPAGSACKRRMDVEPTPAFFAAARVRFLMAAQQHECDRARHDRDGAAPIAGVRFASSARLRRAWRRSSCSSVRFSTYTVASASARMPGDWQYPVKLQTERVRAGARIQRRREARRQARHRRRARQRDRRDGQARGKIIGPGVLDRLVEPDEAADRRRAAAIGTRTMPPGCRAVPSTSSSRASAKPQPQVAPDAQSAAECRGGGDVAKGVTGVTSRFSQRATIARPPS